MKVRYIGSHDEVEIAATGQVCKHGESVDVDDELGKSLLDQETNWQPVKAATSKNKEA